MANRIFTSESVSEGHPDKMADQISDAVLDAILKEDKEARVACETMVKTGMVVLAGEITTSAWVDLEEGIRMQTNLVDCDPDDVAIGQDVEVVFTDVTDEITLPYFRVRDAG